MHLVKLTNRLLTMNQKTKLLYNFFLNNLLLISAFFMILSGFTLQLGFHMGGSHHQERHGNHFQSEIISYEKIREIDSNKRVNAFTYHEWSVIHKFSVVIFTAIMIIHTYLHWRWYKNVILKNLIGKNYLVITLTLLFIIAAITGIIPWLIDLGKGSGMIRLILIEIHDKITLIFTLFIILHVINRINWFHKTFNRLKSPVKI
jgi:hypothetical protein